MSLSFFKRPINEKNGISLESFIEMNDSQLDSNVDKLQECFLPNASINDLIKAHHDEEIQSIMFSCARKILTRLGFVIKGDVVISANLNKNLIEKYDNVLNLLTLRMIIIGYRYLAMSIIIILCENRLMSDNIRNTALYLKKQIDKVLYSAKRGSREYLIPVDYIQEDWSIT